MAAFIIHSDFGAQEEEPVTASTFPPSICHAVMGPDAMILVVLIFSLKSVLQEIFNLLAVIEMLDRCYLLPIC